MRISDWSSDVCSSDLLLRLRRRLLTRLEQWQPDLYIGIDAPDFNLPVERRLKARGITTVHYVSPSLWAWRTGRARRIGESADCVLRSEEHTSELQSLMRNSYAVFCLKKKKTKVNITHKQLNHSELKKCYSIIIE